MKEIFQRRMFLAVALSIGVTASQTLFTPNISAQNNVSGDISGVVTDPTGAVIPGAKITVTSVDTGATQTVLSSSSGNYRASLLKPGAYKLSFTLEGFESVSFTVTVSAGTVSRPTPSFPSAPVRPGSRSLRSSLFSTPRAPKSRLSFRRSRSPACQTPETT